jgi:hypothetical protein
VNLPPAYGEEQRRAAEAAIGGNQPDERASSRGVAAAILGAQGSPVWSRTAESLLLADPEVKRLFRLAARDVDAAMDPS